jgi:DNA-binding NarL/FixJ family response regulator
MSSNDLPLLTGSQSAGLPSGVPPRSSPRHARDRGESTGAPDHREHSYLALAEQLTEREIRVLQLLYGSLTRGEIAAELGVSPNTIKTQTQAIYRKLGVFTRHDAITRGQDTGIL